MLSLICYTLIVKFICNRFIIASKNFTSLLQGICLGRIILLLLKHSFLTVLFFENHKAVVYSSIKIPLQARIFMEEYRSGHNEAVLKTVWAKAHGGSNPSSSAKRDCILMDTIFFIFVIKVWLG